MKKKKTNVTKLKVPKHKKTVEFIGPFVETWAVTCEGYKIPKLSAIVLKNGNILVSLDQRFMIECSDKEAQAWVPMLANALAIGEGYPWYGAKNKEMPFAPQMIGLGEVPK